MPSEYSMNSDSGREYKGERERTVREGLEESKKVQRPFHMCKAVVSKSNQYEYK